MDSLQPNSLLYLNALRWPTQSSFCFDVPFAASQTQHVERKCHIKFSSSFSIGGFYLYCTDINVQKNMGVLGVRYWQIQFIIDLLNIMFFTMICYNFDLFHFKWAIIYKFKCIYLAFIYCFLRFCFFIGTWNYTQLPKSPVSVDFLQTLSGPWEIRERDAFLCFSF